MVSVSNTGKTISVAFTPEERAVLEQHAGDDWKWMNSEFTPNPDGSLRLILSANMMTGRKLGTMTATDRWLLSNPSNNFPTVPTFSRVSVPMTVLEDRHKEFVIDLPRELPPLSEKRISNLRVVSKKVTVIPSEKKPEANHPQQRNGSNITLMIEGKSFRFEAPIDVRLRIMKELAAHAK